MSAENAREFVDANVLVYAYDASAGKKKTAAEELLAQLWEAGNGCLSVQVLQEFFVTVTAKVAEPLSADEAADHVREASSPRRRTDFQQLRRPDRTVAEPERVDRRLTARI